MYRDVVVLFICVWIEFVEAQSASLVDSSCSGNTCLYLYYVEDDYTWQQSYDACRQEELELLRIEDSGVHNTVKSLLNGETHSEVTRVWTAGRGSGETWTYMNGSEFISSGTITRATNDNDCVFITIEKNRPSEVKYEADNCDESQGNSVLLCQYDPGQSGQCSSAYFSHGGRCYVKTAYNGQMDSRIDWFGGQSYCRKMYDGDIAYSDVHNTTWLSSVLNLYDSSLTVQLWFGVRRQPWYWMKGSSPGSERSPITSFYWSNSDLYSSDDRCIYIDHESSDKWGQQSCSNRLKHFICMNGTVAHGPPPGPGRSGGTPGDNDGFKLEYIAAVVCGVVLVAVAVGLAVFFIRRKKKEDNQNPQTKPRHDYVNEEISHQRSEQSLDNDTNIAMETGDGGNEYAEISPIDVNNDVMPDNAISPYAEVGLGKRVSNFLKRKLPSVRRTSTSNNNVYSNAKASLDNRPHVPMKPKFKSFKKTKTSRDDTSKTVKHVQSPTGDLYAIPDKGGNIHPSGSNTVEHFEAGSGDMYALPTK